MSNMHTHTTTLKMCCSPFISSQQNSFYTDSVGHLVTHRKSARCGGYQWKLFTACVGAWTVSHPRGPFPWQLLPASTCGCWQPSEKRPQSLKYHSQCQHLQVGRHCEHIVYDFKGVEGRRAPAFHRCGEHRRLLSWALCPLSKFAIIWGFHCSMSSFFSFFLPFATCT